MIFVGDIVEDAILVLDVDGQPVSGLIDGVSIFATIYDESNGAVGLAVTAEIGVIGVYYADMPVDAEGTWKMHWRTTSPRTFQVHRFVVRDAQDVIADQVWDEALAGHVVAGSAGEAQNRLDDIETDTTAILAAIAALNNLSIADVQTALTNQGYTAGRAVLLDNLTNLDAAISTVIAAIGALNDLSIADVQTAMTNQGYTAVRAILLDNLDAAISAVPAAVDAVLSAVHGLGSWETAACDYHAQPC